MSFQATTIVAVRKDGKTAIVDDGQVTFGQNTIMKHSAVKLRSLADGAILAGFAGSAADAFTLFEKFESKLKDHSNQLVRAAVELAKEWRSDRISAPLGSTIGGGGCRPYFGYLRVRWI